MPLSAEHMRIWGWGGGGDTALQSKGRRSAFVRLLLDRLQLLFLFPRSYEGLVACRIAALQFQVDCALFAERC